MRVPDEVGRYQVGRELDAVELAADHARDRADRQRFRQPRHAFDEDMAARQQRYEHAFQQRILSHDNALDLEQHLLDRRCWFLRLGLSLRVMEPPAARFSGYGRDDARRVLDRHCESETDEHAVAAWVDDAGHDADHVAAAVDQRAA